MVVGPVRTALGEEYCMPGQEHPAAHARVAVSAMPDAPQEREAVDRVYAAMVDRALAAGGTCTGEHGIGMGKKTKLIAEVGQHVVDLMRDTKRAWDPKSILNPGKIF